MNAILNFASLFATFFAMLTVNGSSLAADALAPNHEVVVQLGYTMGTHEGKAKSLIQDLSGTLGDPTSIKGSIKLPITSLDFENEKLNCHFLESIGLDYSKSEFPKSHVCDGDNHLPKEGPNSIAFPMIEFAIDRVSLINDEKLATQKVQIEGTWSIHGIKQKADPIAIELDAMKASKIQVRLPIRLSDFGIQVKSFLFISTADVAEVHLDFKLNLKDLKK